MASRRGALRPRAEGHFEVLGPVDVPGLRARRVRLYVPANHDSARPGAVLVLFDGQNVFGDAGSFAGGWHADRAVERLAKRRPRPLVLGIDHGGEERIHELSPFAASGSRGELDRLIDWVVGGLLPQIRARHAIVDGPVGCAIGGSSMGGLASLYAHFRHPETFGGVLAMSPSLWVGDGQFFRWLEGVKTPWTSRIYLDAGAKEGGMLGLAERLAHRLGARGYGDRLLFKADPRGRHSERDWRKRLPSALRFMYR